LGEERSICKTLQVIHKSLYVGIAKMVLELKILASFFSFTDYCFGYFYVQNFKGHWCDMFIYLFEIRGREMYE